MLKGRLFISFISDVVGVKDLKTGQFNLIAAACGTGKTYWVLTKLLRELPDVKPYEIAFVTSRSIIKEQQSRQTGTTKYRNSDVAVLQYWNGREDDESVLLDYGILLMTYDQIIDAIKFGQFEGKEVLQNVKVIIFDECHVLFSDEFIQKIDMLRLWVREVVYGSRKLFVGLSATTNIIELNSVTWGVPINRINKEVISGYRAKQMICTDFDTIPYLISANKLPGKTIVMCPSIKRCEELASRLSNAAIVVSPHSEFFTDEMKRIRDHIIKYEELPKTYYDADGNVRDLDVLISTSTLREGLNLRESSGVRNVITCLTDELHITQFVGRCRYNIDNLVIADTLIKSDNLKSNDYLSDNREKFKSYMRNKECISWFDGVAHLVDHDVYGVKKFVLGTDDSRFINYINRKWLVPKGIDSKLRQQYRIWKEEDKCEIIDMAYSCKMFDMYKSQITFNRVVGLLENCLGYEINVGRAIIDGGRQTYRLVISYDEDSNAYIPVHKTINDLSFKIA